MKEYRCPDCGRLLFKTDAAAGTIQTVCKDCRAMRTFPIATKAITSQTTRK